MAVVAEYQIGNVTVRMHDDAIEKNQEKAWAEARRVAGDIHWAQERRKAAGRHHCEHGMVFVGDTRV